MAEDLIETRTISAFGEGCSWPVQSFVAKFKDELIGKGAADEERQARKATGSPVQKPLVVAHH